MRKTFYIIDGHAHIYRAYFAPFRDLTSPTGEPAKASFVFTQMLLNLIGQRKPDYLAMVIDSGDETVFRKEIFAEYKANRQAPPEDFGPQEERILRMVRDSGVPIFVKPGFEADDLIATMAARLCDRGFDIVIVSKDKDLRQLLNDCTRMYDVQADSFMDPQSMLAQCGYGPEQVIEVQTLMGDATDNVQGIPGVGEKTAAKLIGQYKTADAILDHLEELTPKLRQNFEQYRDRLPISRKLVTLHRDVPMEFDAQRCAFTGLNLPGLKRHLEELGFSSLIKRYIDPAVGPSAAAASEAPVIGRSSAVKPGRFSEGLFDSTATASEPASESGEAAPAANKVLATSHDCAYHLVDTEEKFARLLEDLSAQKRFAFDTETDGLGAMRSDLVGISVSWEQSCGYYIPVRGPAGSNILPRARVLEGLRPMLENPAIEKVGHNIKYDLLVMRQAGIEVRGVALDSMIAAFMLDASRLTYGIDTLARDVLNFGKIATAELIGKGRSQLTMDRVELDRIARYASEDADIAFRLAGHLEHRLAEIPSVAKLNRELETPLIDVLVEMETNGIAIDPPVLKEQSKVLGERADALRLQICEQAGGEFNCDSPRQLAEVLFTRLGLKVVKRTKTGPSTDVEVLERLSTAHPVPKLVLEYRSLVKLKNTYLDNLTEYVNPRTGRIHASFNQIGASTGRLSCSDPNLQNIPIRTDEGRRIRLAFVPGDRERNVLLTSDYSQIELRVLAHFTKEPALVRAFEADEDIHRAVAAEVFGVAPEAVSREQRNQAKIVNFGIIYGISAMGLARRIDGLNYAGAEALISSYHKRFPAIRQFLDQCVMEAQTKGYVETLLGRRRRIIDIHSGVVAQRNAAERVAINSVVQGTAADLIKIAMLRIHRRLKAEKRPSKLLLQVHDELVFETPADAIESESAMIREEMTGALSLAVPLKVELGWGKNWQEVK